MRRHGPDEKKKEEEEEEEVVNRAHHRIASSKMHGHRVKDATRRLNGGVERINPVRNGPNVEVFVFVGGGRGGRTRSVVSQSWRPALSARRWGTKASTKSQNSTWPQHTATADSHSTPSQHSGGGRWGAHR